MDADTYKQVKDLLNRALDLPPSERSALLDTADSGLREEVKSLLQSMTDAGDFLDEPALSSPQESVSPGDRIGPYRIESKIGDGGMGAVYRAIRVDNQFDGPGAASGAGTPGIRSLDASARAGVGPRALQPKQVAIKLIRRGMDTDFIVRRFRTERQILAALDHPNICRLLDGGATGDGLPYFVMEYIEGRTLHEYCDELKLSISDRLILFRRVCDALQYAHSNLIVHRDLKPSNILVTRDGVPKLLDFGIAKLLDTELTASLLDPTASMFRMMTPEYASPEQVRGESVTTASDVYSLGVVLYELLTGHRPYRITSRAPRDIEEAICHSEPDRPSTAINRVVDAKGRPLTPEAVGASREGTPDRLRRRLRGDLDNVLLKALRKEPQRRYASVEQFSDDIRRHLNGMPVIARNDTLLYRTSKFIGRHKAGVAAAVLLFLSLLGEAAAAMWQARVANVERDRAEHRFNDVRKIANTMLFELHDAIATLPGSTAARDLIVRRAQEYLDSLSHESRGDPTLQRDLALVYLKIGDVQGEPNSSNLGNTRAALKNYGQALALYRSLAAADPRNTDIQRNLATARGRMCIIYQVVGDSKNALENCGQEVAIRESLTQGQPDSAVLKRELASAYENLGGALKMVGSFATAKEKFSAELGIYEDLAAADPADPNARRNVSSAYSRMGAITGLLGDYDSSLRYFHLSLELDLSLAAAAPGDAAQRQRLSFTYSDVGWALAQLGNLRAGLEFYRKALPIRETLANADPMDARVRAMLANTYGRIGRLLLRLDDEPGAAENFRRQVSLNQGLVAMDPVNVANHTDLAEAYENTGSISAWLATRKAVPTDAAAHWRDARNWYRKALEIYLRLRSDGLLHAEHSQDPARLQQEVDRCSTALARTD